MAARGTEKAGSCREASGREGPGAGAETGADGLGPERRRGDEGGATTAGPGVLAMGEGPTGGPGRRCERERTREGRDAEEGVARRGPREGPGGPQAGVPGPGQGGK